MCKISSSKECLQFFMAIINLMQFNLNETLLQFCKTLLSTVFRNTLTSRVCPNLFHEHIELYLEVIPKLTQMPFVNLSERGNTKYTRLTQHGFRVPLILAYTPQQSLICFKSYLKSILSKCISLMEAIKINRDRSTPLILGSKFR